MEPESSPNTHPVLGIISIPLINPNRSSTTIAYIYKHTSPVGLSYVGQTTLSPNERWEQHVQRALDGTGGCRIFEIAIREHKPETFTHEILMVVNENMADYYEAVFVKAYNTVTPNGYNSREGGNGKCSEEMKAQMRIGNVVKTENKQWKYPDHDKETYVCYHEETNKNGTYCEGYRVTDHPKGPPKSFMNSKMTMDEKYIAALDYKLMLDERDTYEDDREKLPAYVTRYNGTGYRVRRPGYASKHYFTGNSVADKSSAYEYLRSICTDEEVKKIFRGLPIPEKK